MCNMERTYRGEVDVNRLRLYSLGEVGSEQDKGVFRGWEWGRKRIPGKIVETVAGRYGRCGGMSRLVLQ